MLGYFWFLFHAVLLTLRLVISTIADRRNKDLEKSIVLVYIYSLGFCGTSLDVENFSKRLMCLSTSGNYTQSKFVPGTVEKNSSTIRSPPGIEPTPVRCRCTALTTKLRR